MSSVFDAKVSWRPDNSPRLFGRLIRQTADGTAKVRRGTRIHTLQPGEWTYEMP
jgi:hypothetical protein